MPERSVQDEQSFRCGCRLAASVDESCRHQVTTDHEKETAIDPDSIGLGDEVRRAYYQQQAEQMQEKARERKEQAAAEWQEWQVSTYNLSLPPPDGADGNRCSASV